VPRESQKKITLQSLLEQVGVAPGQVVLDVGFRDVSELVGISSIVGPQGAVLGIDVDTGYVSEAKQKLAELSELRIDIQHGSVLRIPSEDKAFDLIFCKGILHEVQDLHGAFKELFRVCRPGGFLSIIDIQRFSRLKFGIYKILTRMKGHSSVDVYPGFTEDELRVLLEPYGFRVIEYRVFDTVWKMGFIEVNPFLLKAERKDPGV